MEVDLVIARRTQQTNHGSYRSRIHRKRQEKNPFDGLQQTLSFSLFGFDCVALWRVSSLELEDPAIDKYCRPVRELVENLELPTVYLAAKIIDEFEFCSPDSTRQDAM